MTDADIRNLLENPTHHSHLVVGPTEKYYEKFRHMLRKKISEGDLDANDVWSRNFETLNIDDARAIKEVQNTRPTGPRRVMLVSLQAIQSEAQNSLLKLFEEPSSDTIFIVCAETQSIFLPTVLSRFNIIDAARADERYVDTDNLALRFLAASFKDRLDMLEPIIKEKERFVAINFLNNLEEVLYKKKSESSQSGAQSIDPAIFEDIFSARHFLRSRSPSIKMILEHLASVIPVGLASGPASKK